MINKRIIVAVVPGHGRGQPGTYIHIIALILCLRAYISHNQQYNISEPKKFPCSVIGIYILKGSDRLATDWCNGSLLQLI